MSDRAVTRLARALFSFTTLLMLGCAAAMFLLASEGLRTWAATLPDLAFTVASLSFSIAGVVIAGRQPRNAVAWVLLGVGLSWQVGSATAAYADWGLRRPGSLPGPEYVASFGEWPWVPEIAPLATVLILLFPDGHLPTARWRWWGWLCGAAIVVPSAGIFVYPGPLVEVPSVVNPFGIEALTPFRSLIEASAMLIPICAVGCAVALVRRYRRSAGVQRLQLKWFAFPAGLVAGFYLVTMIASIPYDWGGVSGTPLWVQVLQNGSLFTFMLIPLTVGIAVLRYRLYDIDRLISRTLTYAVLTALLALLYLAAVSGLTSVTTPFLGKSPFAVAAATLMAAAAFRPARRRVQLLVDRRFNRARYDASVMVESYRARLREEVDIDRLSKDLVAVTGTHCSQPACPSGCARRADPANSGPCISRGWVQRST